MKYYNNTKMTPLITVMFRLLCVLSSIKWES